MASRVFVCRVVVTCLALALYAAPARSDVRYRYDALGRLIAVIDTGGDTATYSYDAVGNLLSIDRYATTAVSVISFSPPTGPVGTTVTISGTGFSATPTSNTVTFNGTSATVSSASTTQLVVTVPSGATTGCDQRHGTGRIRRQLVIVCGSVRISGRGGLDQGIEIAQQRRIEDGRRFPPARGPTGAFRRHEGVSLGRPYKRYLSVIS